MVLWGPTTVNISKLRGSIRFIPGNSMLETPLSGLKSSRHDSDPWVHCRATRPLLPLLNMKKLLSEVLKRLSGVIIDWM